MNYSDTIKMLRENRGMKQSKLGECVGVSSQAISKWETGKAEPAIDAILKMCDLFDVSADYLLGRTDWPFFVWKDAHGNTAEEQPEVFQTVELTKDEVAMLRDMLNERARQEKEKNAAG